MLNEPLDASLVPQIGLPQVCQNRFQIQHGAQHLRYPPLGDCLPLHERLSHSLSSSFRAQIPRNFEDLNLTAPGVQFALAVGKNLSKIGYFHLEVSELKSIGTGQSVDRIGYYGHRLPDFIGWAKSRGEGVPIYQAILAEMREVLPELDSIIVTRVGTDQQGLAMSFRNQRGYITAPDLSDGTMLTLGLLCLVHGPKKPAVLCLEEPECGLHPRRMRWVFDRLLQLAYPSPGQQPVQVILTTHSPYLVDLFSDMPESVLIAEQHQGRSKVTPLPAIRSRLRIDNTPSAIGHEWASGLYEGM